MRQDVKIGLLIGLALAIGAIFWYSFASRQNPSLPGPDQSSRQNEPDDNGITERASDDFDPWVGSREEWKDAVPKNNSLLKAKPGQIVSVQPKEDKPIQPGQKELAKYKPLEKVRTQRFHIVMEGETLSGIARKYYGDSGKWRDIYQANRERIEDPDLLEKGEKLLIP